MTQPNSTLITVILDRSGSMGPLQQATIAGFNEFLKGQQAAPGEAQISLIQFDNAYEVNYLARPIKEAPPLTAETYQPRGSTALYDAIGRTIIQTGATLAGLPEASRPSKVIVVIDTDGEENASQEFSGKQINTMIREQTDKYAWEFIFLGANQDAILSASVLGISAQNALNTKASVMGTSAKYQTVNAYALRSRGFGVSGQSMNNGFTDEEREANA